MWTPGIPRGYSLSYVTQAVRIGAGCALAVLTIACSIVRCGPASHLPVVQIGHLTAGDGPFLTRLIVYDDGFLELQTADLRKRCSRDAQAPGRLLDLTRSTAFSSEVSALSEDPHAAPAETEQVGAKIPDLTFLVAIENEPPAVMQFLKEADATFRRAFGSRYDISLVPAGAHRPGGG